MDYQPMGEMPNPPMNQMPGAPMTPDSHQANGIWYVVGAAVIIALGLWYYYAMPAAAPTASTPTAIDQTQMAPLTSGNTTADIAKDLSAIPDDTAALQQDAAASAQNVSGL